MRKQKKVSSCLLNMGAMEYMTAGRNYKALWDLLSVKNGTTASSPPSSYSVPPLVVYPSEKYSRKATGKFCSI